MKYEIHENRIVTESCEINAVHQCNLSCRGCSHLSPALPKSFVDPDALFRTLSDLARVLAPRRVQIVGGEPLLHPNLVTIVEAIRRSGISPRIRIVSNATLLNRFTADLISTVDEIQLSIYPGFEPVTSVLNRVRALAEETNGSVEIKNFDFFREPCALLGTSDTSLIQRIYNTCKIAHSWQCHTVEGAAFYKCPQSVFMRHAQPSDSSKHGDRIIIDQRTSLFDELYAFLQSPLPLQSCNQCLGSVGKLYMHQQRARNGWLAAQEQSVEQLVDFKYLEILESGGLEFDNMCARDQWQDPANSKLISKYADDASGSRHAFSSDISGLLNIKYQKST